MNKPRVYKTDLGSLVSIVFGFLMFLTLTLLAFFAFGGAPLGIKIGTLLITIINVYFFFDMLNHSAIITDDEISVRTTLFVNKYKTIKFSDVTEVSHAMGLFPESTVIFLKTRDKKNLVGFMVGFGLPWDALLDVMEHIPKDAKVNFEPELWKRIKKPLRNETVKKRNIIYAAVTILVLIWFAYYLHSVFKLHRVPFPINLFSVSHSHQLYRK